jgi:NAD(P)-dependent dehydrogenase (short-subunit alcohol dehydrogenase family)
MAGMFDGKVVLVTGGGQGMGKSAAQRFAEEGAKVAIVDLNLEAAHAVVDWIGAKGGEAIAIRADIADQGDNDRMVAETVARFGGLHAAFLNAAYLGPVLDFFETDAATFDKIVNINLRGCFFGMQATARAMGPGGSVVVNASTAAMAANQYNAVYTATKHGVVGLVKAAAEPFGARKLRINAICAGYIATPMNGLADSVEPSPADALAPTDFCGMGLPQHIAELAVFLASSRAAFLTGATYLADGGLMANIPSVRF